MFLLLGCQKQSQKEKGKDKRGEKDEALLNVFLLIKEYFATIFFFL